MCRSSALATPFQFSASSVVDMYSKFTSNFMNAKLTIQQMRKQRPSFARFLEVGLLSYP